MSMLSKQRAISKRVFFSPKRLAEPVTYNGVSVNAIVEIGTEMARGDWNDAATPIERASLADQTIFTVCAADLINKPREGDWIVYNSVKYKAVQTLQYDSQADAYVILAMKDGRGYGAGGRVK